MLAALSNTQQDGNNLLDAARALAEATSKILILTIQRYSTYMYMYMYRNNCLLGNCSLSFPLSFSVSLSLCVFLSPCVFLFLSVFLSVCVTVSVCLSVCLSLSLCLCFSVYLSASLYLSIILFLCPESSSPPCCSRCNGSNWRSVIDVSRRH